MNSFDTAFIAKLKEELEKLQLQMAVDLSRGGAQDYSVYRYSCGIVEGIRQVLVLIDQVNESIQKG